MVSNCPLTRDKPNKDSQSRVLHVGTSTVTDRLVRDAIIVRLHVSRRDETFWGSGQEDLREFTEVVTSHLWLDLDGGERLSVL